VRHQDTKQKRDYDEFYLDWIFWVYLTSVELTNRVIDEHARKRDDSTSRGSRRLLVPRCIKWVRSLRGWLTGCSPVS